MTFYFYLVIVDETRPDQPQLAKESSTMRQDDRSMRPMQFNAFLRVQQLIYSKFGNAWRMPKSIRDNYRSIKPVHNPREAARLPQEEK